MLRRLRILAFTTAILVSGLFAVSPVNASINYSQCGQDYNSDNNVVLVQLFEFPGFQSSGSYTSEPGVLCIYNHYASVNISNFKNIPYHLAPSNPLGDEICNYQNLTSVNTWNDCVSGYKVSLPNCYWTLSFYNDANYVTRWFTLHGPGYWEYSDLRKMIVGPQNISRDDVMSSLILTYDTGGC